MLAGSKVQRAVNNTFARFETLFAALRTQSSAAKGEHCQNLGLIPTIYIFKVSQTISALQCSPVKQVFPLRLKNIRRYFLS